MTSGVATPDQPEASPSEAGLPTDTPLSSGTVDRRPVGTDERLVSLDFIRGVAVLGILFANITAFAHPFLAYYWPGALPEGGNAADDAIWLFQLVFVDGKFRGLFTILFGAGMYLFMERTWQRGGTTWRQVRRLLLLAVFGLGHFYLLFRGDILFLYSVAGLLSLPLLSLGARKQLWTGLVWYVLASLLFVLTLGSQMAIEQNPAFAAKAGDAAAELEDHWAGELATARAESAVMSGDSYADIVAYRFTEQSGDLGFLVILAFFETIPLMLVGMGLYRLGFFSGRLDPGRMRLWGWIGVATGAVATLAFGGWAFAEEFPPALTSFVFNGASALTRLPIVLGLAALLSLWASAAAGNWLGERLVAAGRMAFSNYIGTSLLMALVFQGWAGGLFGELHRSALLLVVLVTWAIILAWSKPWLAKFRYGPLEWVWRCLTYGKLFTLRR